MGSFQFLQEYDPALDPTPEDEEYTPRDLVIIVLNELRGMQAEDFNLWRADRIPALENLLKIGIEIDGELRLPAPPKPEEITDWDDDGYSVLSSYNCHQYRNIHETAAKWADSGNRLLRQASFFMARQWYMLPIPRLAGDEAFELAYLKNATCTPHAPMGTLGRSGYINKAVFAEILEEQITDRTGRELTKYQGVNPVEDHRQPITGTNMSDLVANIRGLFEDRFKPNGAGFYGFLVTGAGEVFDMDRYPGSRDATWRPPLPQFQFNRAAEIEQAWAIAKQL